ncbi:MAG: hypothetical protein WC960_02070 [Bacteroidales bacterium]
MKIVTTNLQVTSFNFRNDNTLIRDCEVLYLPPFVRALYAVVGYAFRVDRPAKNVDPSFGSRYISHYTPALCFDGSKIESGILSDSPAVGTFLDHSSLIPLTLYPIEDTLSSSFKVKVEGVELIVSESGNSGLRTIANHALSTLSRLFTLKTGDFIFVEIEKSKEKLTKGELEFFFNQTLLYNFEIK